MHLFLTYTVFDNRELIRGVNSVGVFEVFLLPVSVLVLEVVESLAVVEETFIPWRLSSGVTLRLFHINSF